MWKRYIHILSQAGICSSVFNGLMADGGGLLSFSDCCAHMDSGLVRPSILVAAAKAPR